jgi:hypothetical protein
MNVTQQEISPAFKYAVFSIPATILLIIPNFTDPINLPKLLALSVLAFVSIILHIALRKYTKIQQKYHFESKALLLLYCLLGISMLVAGLSNNGNYIRAILGTSGRNNGLIYYISVILIAILLLKLTITEIEVSYIYRIIAFTSIIFSLYCAMQYFYLDPVNWSNPYNRVVGTLGNPNFSASALAIFSVFWAYLFTRTSSQKTFVRFLILFIAVSMAFLSWSTASIQGIIVFFAGISLIAYVTLRERSESKLIPYIFSLGGGLSLIFIFISFLGIGPLGSQLEQYTLKLRGYYAYFGILQMLDSPWNGVGVDNYISAFRAFRSEEFIARNGVALATNNAHSLPAQIGATFGIVVFIFYCLLHMWILFKALIIINSRDRSMIYMKGVALIWILVFSQSLLSIEIIGLGVMNWVLGAILLNGSWQIGSGESGSRRVVDNRLLKLKLPAWVGSLTIASFVVGMVPVVAVSIEDRAFRNIVTIRLENAESKAWVRENFQKLSKFTLWDSSNVVMIVNNLFQSGLGEDVEELLLKLHELNPRDPYPIDLLASFYANSNEIDKEIEFYLKFLTVDPLNYQMELLLANAYVRKGDVSLLKESVERIKALAPESQEFLDAQALLEQLETESSD